MNRSAVSKLFAGIVSLLWAVAAPGQFADSPVSAGVVKLFGGVNFVAKADVQVLDTNRQETLRTPLGFACLDGKMRVEIDMTRMTGKAVPPATVTAFKQIGLDRVVSIFRPDKKMIHLVFTGVRSYASMEMSPAEAEATQKNLKILKTVLGQETVDHHPCIRNKVLIKNSKGAVLLEATTWNATDLKDFPVQIAVPAKDSTTILRFSQIQIGRPPAAQFEPPAGFTKYHSPETLVLAARMTQTAPTAPTRTAAPKTPTKVDARAATTRK